jgi:serine O-acetyltransferase
MVAYYAAYSVVRLATGIDLPRTVVAGPGLRIHHFAGVVIHGSSTLGKDVTLRHGVTIGVRHVNGGAPRIGDSVDVGVGAVILGDIAVGDRVKVGAMTLVITDVPADQTIVGVPGWIVRRGDDA